MTRPFRLHAFVDYDGIASCGAGHPPTVAVPARDILDTDCKRCLADPEVQYAIRKERRRLELRASLPAHLRPKAAAPVIPIAPRLHDHAGRAPGRANR